MTAIKRLNIQLLEQIMYLWLGVIVRALFHLHPFTVRETKIEISKLRLIDITLLIPHRIVCSIKNTVSPIVSCSVIIGFMRAFANYLQILNLLPYFNDSSCRFMAYDHWFLYYKISNPSMYKVMNIWTAYSNARHLQ